MILHIRKNINPRYISEIAADLHAQLLEKEDFYIFLTSSRIKLIPDAIRPYVIEYWITDSDMQISSRQYHPETRRVDIADICIGGDEPNTLMIAGPCAVESEEQMDATCRMLVSLGLKTVRAGSFKPRTSPYTFRGLGDDALRILAAMREKYGLKVVTEARDASNMERVIECADVVQIGTKSMFDNALLAECGRCGKPVILKRAFGATLREFANCADFIMSKGNDRVILCERGIRSFETDTRFTLDLCGVAWLKRHTNLPVIVDPSHAMGAAYGVPDLARAAVAMGIDGIMIETHPNPRVALSDAAQQLDFDTFRRMTDSLKKVASAVDRNIV